MYSRRTSDLTNNEQFKKAITFLTVYNSIFNVANSNSKFNFKKSIFDEDFIQISIPNGAYKIESLNNEIRRTLSDKEYYTEANYPFTIKPNFSTLGSNIEIQLQEAVIGFVFNDSIANLLGFKETLLYKEYNLSHNPADTLSFDNIFLETDIAQGMTFRSKMSGKYIILQWM